MEAPPEPLELLFGLLTAAWGMWVMAPWWDVFALSPTVYRLLLSIIPDEFVWGLLSASLGVSMLRSLYHDARVARFWCSVCLTSLWATLATGFAFSDWRSPATLWYLILASAAAWLITRTRSRLIAERLLSERARGRQEVKQTGGEP